MAVLKVRPVARPKSFADVKFTQAEWDEATKIGALSLPRVTAMEALRNSRGLYEIEAEKRQEVDLKVGGLSVAQMDRKQLLIMAAQMGRPVRKKAISMSDLRRHVDGLLDAVDVVDDDAAPVDDETEEEDGE